MFLQAKLVPHPKSLSIWRGPFKSPDLKWCVISPLFNRGEVDTFS